MVSVEQQQRVAMLKYLNSFPPGYRFCPTDKELVLDYLKNKVMNKPLPPNKIMDINLYNHGPQDLSEQEEKTLYFFTPRDRKYPKGTRPNRAAGRGYWKATGVDNIIGRKENPIGYRKSLVYYQGYPKKSKKTNWIMHEYRIDHKSPARSSTAAPHDMKLDDWVLCKVYLKDKKSDKDNREATSINTDATSTNPSISSSISQSPPLLMQTTYNYSNVPYVHGSTSSATPPLHQGNNNLANINHAANSSVPPLLMQTTYYSNVPYVHGSTSSATPPLHQGNNNLANINHAASSSVPLLQSNNNVANINLGATSSAPPLQSNNNVANINFGATSSAAPPMETINCSNVMLDQQFFHDYDYTSSLFEEVWNNCLVDLPVIEFPPSNFDDVKDRP
ncbi:NAC transcription factor 32 [Citrus sinensis]|uniref:NAC transcription factor 32 n=1 Tax=Citrus sinensis TaxID=2711 RepID=A0ACB8HVZ7_CITSI|nr:NAC transcription factor 32 [Citrus sinensis]